MAAWPDTRWISSGVNLHWRAVILMTDGETGSCVVKVGDGAVVTAAGWAQAARHRAAIPVSIARANMVNPA
jgi:hypothetical protein